MDLYSRNAENELLRRQKWLSKEQFSQMTIITGPRMSGKTSLAASLRQQCVKDGDGFLYFDLRDKSEPLMVYECTRQAEKALDAFVPKTTLTMGLMLEFLFGLSELRAFTLVLDDFDDFVRKNPGFQESLHSLWKSKRRRTHMNLVIISCSPKVAESLPGTRIDLDYLSGKEISSILGMADQKAGKEDLLAMYMVTGGCPSFVSEEIRCGATRRDTIFRWVFSADSNFNGDIKGALADILGHNPEAYLSILQLISLGFRTLPELEEKLGGISLGGYLAKLENEYCLVTKQRPILASPSSRNTVSYYMKGQQMEFWFRYFFSWPDEAALGSWESMRQRAEQDFRSYSKQVMVRFLRRKFLMENGITELGGDWKSTQLPRKKSGRYLQKDKLAQKSKRPEAVFETDIIALDRKHRNALIADVEYDTAAFRKDEFKERVAEFAKGPLRGYTLDTRLFTLDDL